jgi:hypothetical protein
MDGRFTRSIGNKKAATFIEKEFEKIGLLQKDSINGYLDKAWYGKTDLGYNIVGILPSKDSIKSQKKIIFCAHYDHIGHNNNPLVFGFNIDKKDSIYNGANDNASGVAAMLALARYYKANPINNYTILFVAFTGEELGLWGSQSFVKKLKRKEVKMVFNLEMLGRPSEKGIRPYITGRNFDLVKQLNKNLLQKDSSVMKDFFSKDSYPKQRLFTRSDNYSFNQIMLSSPLDDYYHTNLDDINTINFNAMLLVVKAIAIACSPFLQ